MAGTEVLDSGAMERVTRFAQHWRGDAKLRTRAEADPRAVLSEHGIDLVPGRDVRIAANTAETFHVVLPPDPNNELADAQLETVAGGNTALPVTRQEFKSASTILSCFACAS